MSCLGVLCRVRNPEDAQVHQQSHTCVSQEEARNLVRTVV
jgi:hypothetical protein